MLNSELLDVHAHSIDIVMKQSKERNSIEIWKEKTTVL